MLDTFVKASIKMEDRGLGSWNFIRSRLFNSLFRGRYEAIGPAKITDAEMEGEYGEIVDKAHPGQIGLGLRDGSCGFFTCDMDQAKPDVAELAMKTRLTIRLDICVQKKCTPTDMVIVSLLAADERLTTTEIKTALSSGEYKSIHQSVTVNWGEFISDNWPSSDDQSKNKQLINLFTGYVKESQPSDFPLMDWNYISSLSP